MDIIKLLTEMAKSTDPQAFMDLTFKKENSDPHPDAELLITDMHNHMISVLTKFDEPWMTDKDRAEAKEMVIAELESKGAIIEMRNSINDAISRNYDMVKFCEFMKTMTTMMSK